MSSSTFPHVQGAGEGEAQAGRWDRAATSLLKEAGYQDGKAPSVMYLPSAYTQPKTAAHKGTKIHVKREKVLKVSTS